MSNIRGVSIDKARDLGGRLGLHARDHVCVLLERETSATRGRVAR
jgi:hypothetical protein